jgi:hypothetical protein
MNKADNFNAGKWMVENKITTQSRLNEDQDLDKKDETLFHQYYEELLNYGIVDLAGEESDMIGSMDGDGSFKEFLQSELQLAKESNDDGWVKIIEKYFQQL